MNYIFSVTSNLTKAEVDHMRDRARDKDIPGILQLLAFTDLKGLVVMPTEESVRLSQKDEVQRLSNAVKRHQKN